MNGYNKLIEDFCALTGIEDVNDVLHRGLLDVEDVPMRLESSDSGDQCRVLADLGKVPPGRETDLYRLMLESNFECDDERGLPILSISPDENRGVLTMHFPVSSLLDEGGLVQALRDSVLPLVKLWSATIIDGDLEREDGGAVVGIAV
jgi:hypothetical protein